ncbi:MAG: hypothetical protein KF752_15960 [Pirellulaceae bacterium]|nr:hypothetical protein [Pirellulaceae bacterium]
MNRPHNIRLAHPWTWGGESSAENSLLLTAHRHFHRPSGLILGQPVWLAVECQNGCRLARVQLNGQQYPMEGDATEQLRWRIEQLLQDRNLLEISLSIPAQQPAVNQTQLSSTEVRTGHPHPRVDVSAWAEVKLEIEATA